jgi:two-component system sensor histidine kinase KdpD
VRRARGFDVVMIAPTGSAAASPALRAPAAPGAQSAVRWDRYAQGAGISALCTLLALAMYGHFELSNLVMIYLLGVTVAGLRLGRGPSALTAVLNVIALDFFFVPPRYSFAVSDAEYLVTFGTMVTIALVIASLTASVRQQTRVAGARERRTALLYAMSRELAATRGTPNMARVAVRHVAEVFQCQAVVLLPDATGKLSYPRDTPLESSFRHADLAVAQWVADHGKPAGLGTDTLPAAPGLYLPLGDESRTVGVLGVRPGNARRVLLPEQSHLLSTFAGQIALALERARLGEVAEQASLAAERETLRNTLLASISHDLRTPLAVMTAAGSTLAQHGPALDEATRVELARSVETKAREMSELVSNVLDLVRLESGQVVLRRDWQTVDDLVGSALTAYREKLAAHPTELRLAADLPPVWVDATLIVQVFSNLFDNIAKYTPPGTHLTITAVADAEREFVRVTVDDDGPGLPAGDPARLFDKFQRGQEEGSVVGVGLGLAICQAIVRAHGGHIEALRRDGGGARFTLTLPATQGAPA